MLVRRSVVNRRKPIRVALHFELGFEFIRRREPRATVEFAGHDAFSPLELDEGEHERAGAAIDHYL